MIAAISWSIFQRIAPTPEVVCVLVVPAVSRGVSLSAPFSPPPRPFFFVSLFVYITFQLSFFMRSQHILATVQCRFSVSVYFSFGWSSRPMGDPGEGSAIIYDYFFESVHACRLCKAQRRPSLAWVRTNLSPTITFSDDTMGKHSRAFTTPRVVPFCSYLFISSYITL